MKNALTTYNGETFKRSAVPSLPFDEFRSGVLDAFQNGERLVALFGMPGEKDGLEICAVLSNDAWGSLSVCVSKLPEKYESLTPICPQAHLFEREIAENWGVIPAGHPWLKPVRAGTTNFFRVEGEEVHEVAVGPVHAGVIEPGHFRFQCTGETVLHLEIALGYQHRGVERALIGGPNLRTVHYMETLAGDTSIGHSLAYCSAIEGLSGVQISLRAQGIRGIALELERLACHAGDLGALAGDVGYLPTSAYCGRIRGDFLNLQALICGSRFGRGLVRPGGVVFDVEPERAEQLSSGLKRSISDLENAAQLLWDSPSVLSRFDDAGKISEDMCNKLGLVGPVARACGIERDVRTNFPSGIYRYFHLPVSTWHRGDVFARAFVRWLEAKKSAAFILDQLAALSKIEAVDHECKIGSEQMVVSMVEGWRGEICHVAVVDKDSRFSTYKVIDPSFKNWMGLAMALRDGQISDFPLNNKSFNLSYCGHDL